MFETAGLSMLLIFGLLTLATWAFGLNWPERWVFSVLAFCWLLFGIFATTKIWRAGVAQLSLGPAVLILILGIGVVLPGATITRWLMPVNHLLETLRKQYPNLPLTDLTAGKIGHILFFSAISCLVFVFRKRLQLTIKQLTWGLLLLALATEGMQLFIRSRGTSAFDIGLDGFGVAVGLGLGVIIVALVQNLKPRENTKLIV